MSTSTQRLGPYSIANRVTYSAMEDPTTGMDLPADGEVAFWCNGQDRVHIRDNAANSRFDVSGAGTDTGNVIAVEDANDLTTGNLLYLYSDASGGQARSLVKVINDNSGARLTTCIDIKDDGTDSTGILIDKNGTGGSAIIVNTDQQTGDVLSVFADNITEGHVMKVYTAGALTSGGFADFLSSSPSTTSRDLVRVVNGNSSAIGATCLLLQNISTGTTLKVDHDGLTGTAVHIDGEQTTGTLVDIDAAALTTGKALDISDADALTLGTLIDVHSNSGNSEVRSLMRVVNDNITATQARCLELRNDAPSATLVIDNNSTTGGQALVIDSEQTSSNIVDIAIDTLTTGVGLYMYQGTGLTTGSIAEFWSNSSSTSTRSLVKIVNDSTSATNASCLELHNDGVGIAAMKFAGTSTIGIDFSSFGVDGSLFKATATTDSVSANPETVSETGWIKIKIGADDRYIPFYTA